jgi:hypothetical protein
MLVSVSTHPLSGTLNSPTSGEPNLSLNKLTQESLSICGLSLEHAILSS